MKNSFIRLIKSFRWKPEDYFINTIHTIIITVVTFAYWYTSPVPYTFKSYFNHMLPMPFIFAVIGTLLCVYKAELRHFNKKD